MISAISNYQNGQTKDINAKVVNSRENA